MRACKIPDILSAGAVGAARWLVAFGLSLMLAVPVMRLGMSYTLRGGIAPSPVATPEARPGPVPVEEATEEEAALIHEALSELSLRFDPTGVTVRVVGGLATCDQCAAAYLPELREILIPRGVVAVGGPNLRWALAHELGHHVDTRYMTEELRGRFGETRRHPADISWLSLGRPWAERPAEDFAEVFAVLVQPTVDRPIGTAYGRLRDRDGIEEILAEADLDTYRPTRSPWTEAVTGQGRYLAETLRDPLRLAALQALALGAAVLGAGRSVLRRLAVAGCGPPAPAQS
ncbi:MAG: hypothetical protein IBX62_05570 [Coriobacteriia bacterium]|nr:hypothetical protein [Coriobacteriia bacterium]